jgi:hypothetical protein
MVENGADASDFEGELESYSYLILMYRHTMA